MSRVLVYVEAAAVHDEQLRMHASDYSPQVRIRAATGLAIPAQVYERALALRTPALREFVGTVLARCDVLHLPTLPIVGPTLADTDVGGGAPMWAEDRRDGAVHRAVQLPRSAGALDAVRVHAEWRADRFSARGTPVRRADAAARCAGVRAVQRAVAAGAVAAVNAPCSASAAIAASS